MDSKSFLQDILLGIIAFKRNIPVIDFGTLGVKFYAGPGQPLDEPRINRPLSIDVADKVVGVVESVEGRHDRSTDRAARLSPLCSS